MYLRNQCFYFYLRFTATGKEGSKDIFKFDSFRESDSFLTSNEQRISLKTALSLSIRVSILLFYLPLLEENPHGT